MARESRPADRPLRFVFYLQNHGFVPPHSRPEGIDVDERKVDRLIDVPLGNHKLPRFIDPLEPFRDRLTVVHGLNGKHAFPYHGAPFGALGGFKKSESMPKGETIDCALSRTCSAVVPLLALGWESLERMKNGPVQYASSAWGAGQPAPMFCDPTAAYTTLFGVAQGGQARAEFEADTELFDFVQRDAERMRDRLSGDERQKFLPYLEGFQAGGTRRRKLAGMADTLARFSPKVTEKFTKPRFEIDWWDASLDVGIQALRSGVTRVLTIASGLCHSGSSWIGLNLSRQGHQLGHTDQLKNPDWLKLRRYNMEHLARIVKALEATPEGDGTMMDNTLLVYSSCHGESQHSTGDRWPFLLLGDLGGRLKTGRYLHYPIRPKKGSRTINALYATLLHAAGDRRDAFNLSGKQAGLDRPGPLENLLA